MTRPPSIPADLWDAIPPNLRPAIAAVVAGRDARIADREARLGQTSANSSLPPSANPPHAKPAPPRAPSGKRKGGQPGHPKAERPILAADAVVPLEPTRCRRCSHDLAGGDPAPLAHQVHEVPEVRPHVTEYRRHRLACPGCGAVTGAPLPVGASGGYGPRAQAVGALLAGGHRLGTRAVAQVLGDLFGLPIRPAAVCDPQAKTAAALEPIHARALAASRTRPANGDETGWTQGRSKAWLWVAVTATVTAFVIRLSRGRAAFHDLAGPTPPVLTTDRYAVCDHLPGDRRQVCWTHLRRDSQALIDRANGGGARSGPTSSSTPTSGSTPGIGSGTGPGPAGGSAGPASGGSGPRSDPSWSAGPRPRAPRRRPRAGRSRPSSRPCGRSPGWPGWNRRTAPPSERCVMRCAGGRRAPERIARPGAGSSSGCSP